MLVRCRPASVDRRRLRLARDPCGGDHDACVRCLALRLAQHLRIVDALDVEADGKDHGRRHERPRERATAGLVGARHPREPLGREQPLVSIHRCTARPPILAGGQIRRNATPITRCTGTRPVHAGGSHRESPEFPRLSPRTNSMPSGTVVGGKSFRGTGRFRYGSSTGRPFTKSAPVRSISTVSPGRPTTRFTKSSCGGSATPRVSPSQCSIPPTAPRTGLATSGPSKTITSPRSTSSNRGRSGRRGSGRPRAASGPSRRTGSRTPARRGA